MKKSDGQKNDYSGRDIPIPGVKGLLLRGGSIYAYKRTVNGRKLYYTLKAITEDDAKAEAQKINTRVLTPGEIDKIEAEYKSEQISLIQFFNEIASDEAEEVENLSIRPSSQKRYKAIRETFQYFIYKSIDEKDLKGKIRTSTKKKSAEKIALEQKALEDENLKNVKLAQITTKVVENYFKQRSKSPIVPPDHYSRKHTRATCVNGASEKTLSLERMYLNKIFAIAVDKNYLLDNPVKKVVATKEENKRKLEQGYRYVNERSFTNSEIKLLLASAIDVGETLSSFGNYTLSDLLEFLFLTGLREQELINLTWEQFRDGDKEEFGENGSFVMEKQEIIEQVPIDNRFVIDFVQKLVSEKSKDDYAFTKDELKNINIRSLPMRSAKDWLSLKVKDIECHSDKIILNIKRVWIPKGKAGLCVLSERAREIIDDIALKNDNKKTGYVFAGKSGGKLKTHLLPILKRTIEKAGLDDTNKVWTLHSTRHTYGRRLRDKEVELNTIRELMRHKNIKDTLIYSRFSPGKVGSKAVKLLDDFE